MPRLSNGGGSGDSDSGGSSDGGDFDLRNLGGDPSGSTSDDPSTDFDPPEHLNGGSDTQDAPEPSGDGDAQGGSSDGGDIDFRNIGGDPAGGGTAEQEGGGAEDTGPSPEDVNGPSPEGTTATVDGGGQDGPTAADLDFPSGPSEPEQPDTEIIDNPVGSGKVVRDTETGRHLGTPTEFEARREEQRQLAADQFEQRFEDQFGQELDVSPSDIRIEGDRAVLTGSGLAAFSRAAASDAGADPTAQAELAELRAMLTGSGPAVESGGTVSGRRGAFFQRIRVEAAEAAEEELGVDVDPSVIVIEEADDGFTARPSDEFLKTTLAGQAEQTLSGARADALGITNPDFREAVDVDVSPADIVIGRSGDGGVTAAVDDDFLAEFETSQRDIAASGARTELLIDFREQTGAPLGFDDVAFTTEDGEVSGTLTESGERKFQVEQSELVRAIDDGVLGILDETPAEDVVRTGAGVGFDIGAGLGDIRGDIAGVEFEMTEFGEREHVPGPRAAARERTGTQTVTVGDVTGAAVGGAEAGVAGVQTGVGEVVGAVSGIKVRVGADDPHTTVGAVGSDVVGAADEAFGDLGPVMVRGGIEDEHRPVEDVAVDVAGDLSEFDASTSGRRLFAGAVAAAPVAVGEPTPIGEGIVAGGLLVAGGLIAAGALAGTLDDLSPETKLAIGTGAAAASNPVRAFLPPDVETPEEKQVFDSELPATPGPLFVSELDVPLGRPTLQEVKPSAAVFEAGEFEADEATPDAEIPITVEDGDVAVGPAEAAPQGQVVQRPQPTVPADPSGETVTGGELEEAAGRLERQRQIDEAAGRRQQGVEVGEGLVSTVVSEDPVQETLDRLGAEFESVTQPTATGLPPAFHPGAAAAAADLAVHEGVDTRFGAETVQATQTQFARPFTPALDTVTPNAMQTAVPNEFGFDFDFGFHAGFPVAFQTVTGSFPARRPLRPPGDRSPSGDREFGPFEADDESVVDDALGAGWVNQWATALAGGGLAARAAPENVEEIAAERGTFLGLPTAGQVDPDEELAAGLEDVESLFFLGGGDAEDQGDEGDFFGWFR